MSRLDRETDLRLFIRRQRFLVSGMLGLLSKRQRSFLTTSSQLVLTKEASSSEQGKIGSYNRNEGFAESSSSG